MYKSSYRVIEIIDEYSILVNYGREDGASKDGQVRIVYTGPEVVDPVTSEILGTLDTVKAELTIVNVYEKFSLCQNIEVRKNNVFVNPLSQFQYTSKEAKILDVDEKNITNKKMPKGNKIAVGDKVEVL